MYILGINAYHGGASACLIEDGVLIAAVEEERFKRVKYWAGFPAEAINYCLSVAGISPYDLDHIGISRNPNAHLLKKILFTLSNRPSFNLIRNRLTNAAKVRDPKTALVESLRIKAEELRAEIHLVEHHQAHLASAFFVSPFQEAAIISVDGMGDFVSTMWGIGRGNQIEAIGSINFPHSLGWLYTAVSQWLGFPKYGDEGKVMGLAPYGQPIYIDKFEKIIQIQSDGTFELNMDYFALDANGSTMSWSDGAPELDTLFSQKFANLFGEPRQPRTEITEYHQNVASSLQAKLEEAEFALVNMVERESNRNALCMAGGVALNSSFNGKILPCTKFEDVYIHPAAGDAGTALGVCYFIWHQELGQPRKFVMRDAYTGPQFINGVIQSELERQNIQFQSLPEDELVKDAAEIVANGGVLGWFQGRLEWGPRALGNRSIIADPRFENMKDILNARVKHREKFRPFAPSILLESVSDYFDQSYPDPFMIKVYNVLPEKRSEIPAVTHIDGTGRLQTVDNEYSPLYWLLIDAFRERTGVPVVLNTSFNENEPIVCTPQEAIDCFLRTKMDALGIGNYLISKEN